MMNRFLTIAAFAAALLAPASALAHRAWIAPSAATVSGEDPWVTFDAASSNTLFYADHNAMRLDGMVITAPDGSTVAPENMTRGRYRTTFDVHLTQTGTYRVVNASQGIMARYDLNGEQRNWRGAANEFATAIPAGATNVRVTENANRVETFVTRGAPTQIAPVNTGLELAPITHPNDLVAGEPARFRFLLDGRPAANLQVTLSPGGGRYRDNAGDVTVITGADGSFTANWPSAGLWWINASVRDLPSQVRNATRSANYSGVLEVLP